MLAFGHGIARQPQAMVLLYNGCEAIPADLQKEPDDSKKASDETEAQAAAGECVGAHGEVDDHSGIDSSAHHF